MTARRVAAVLPVLVALGACGTGGSAGSVDRGHLEDALAVELTGYRPVGGPVITAVCDPSAAGEVPPELPAELGTPVAAHFARAESTVEVYAWVPGDDEVMGAVDEVVAAADACAYQQGSEVQVVEPWAAGGWDGVRVNRTVPDEGAAELVERRLVRGHGVVLLAVLRSDVLDEEQLRALDEVLGQVDERLG